MKHTPLLKRAMSWLLTLTMCLSLLPGVALAEDAAKTWTKVTDVSALTTGDTVIIVAADSDAAMSTNQKTSNRGQVSVTKTNDGNTISETGVDGDYTVQELTVEAGNKDGTFAFYTGSGYLYAASSSSNHLKTEASLSDNSSWTVEITDGIATITAQGENTRNWMRHNASNSLFACYASTSNMADICIYELDSGSGSGEPVTPTAKKPAASITSGTVVFPETEVTISCGTDGATVYEKKGENWEAMQGDTITLPAEAGTYTYTLKAVADGYNESSEAELTYLVAEEMTVAEARGLSANDPAADVPAAGDPVAVTGKVVRMDKRNVFVQDAPGGINLYFDAAPNDFSVGDVVTACGKFNDYNGLAQLESVSQYTVTEDAEPLPSTTVTISDLLTDYSGNNAYESTRVYLENAVVGTKNGKYLPLTRDESTINIYNPPAELNDYIAGDIISLYAVVSDYNGYQLLVNAASDVTLVSQAALDTFTPGYNGTKAAGETVTFTLPREMDVVWQVKLDDAEDWEDLNGNTYTLSEEVGEHTLLVRASSDQQYSQTLTIEWTVEDNTGGEEPEEPEDTHPVPNGTYVIYAPAYNKALSSTYGGYYNTGVDVTLSNGEISGYGAAEVWTVTNNDNDQTITIAHGGQNLAMAASFSSLTLGEVNDKWTLEDAGNGLFYVKNVGRSSYIEWYASKNYWSGYGTINEGSEGMFALSFIPVEPAYAVDNDVEVTIAQWGGGGIYTDEDNATQVYGDKFVSGDQQNTSAVYTVVANGAPAKPFMTSTPQTGGTNYYMGGTNIGQAEGDYMQLAVSSAGWGEMELSFRLRATNAGPGEFQLCYSTDGGSSFKNFSSGTYSYSYTKYNSEGSTPVNGSGSITNGIAKTSLAATYYVTFAFDVPSGAANCDNLLIRLVPSNTKQADGDEVEVGKVTGNIRFDSVVLTGSPIVDNSVTGYVTVTPNGVDEDVPMGAELTMTSATEGATIHYRMDEGDWQTYNDASKPTLSILPTIVEVYATSENRSDSVSLTYRYDLGTVESVKMTPNGGGLYIEGESTTVTLSCETEGATIYYNMGEQYDGVDVYTEYTEPLTIAKGFGTQTIKAYAVKDGYNESAVVSRTFTEMDSANYNIYFGQVHSHTAYSDGAGTADDAFKYASTQAEEIDFLAVTDHSNSFDGTYSFADGSGSTEWVEGHALAEQYTDEDFVGLFGYEMTWSNGLGHINTFNSEGFVSRTDAEYTTYNTALQNYYATLKTNSDALSQFNHPGTTFGDFSDFAHFDEEIDDLITMIEVGNGEGAIGSSGYFPSYEYYTRALDKGWHVAPTNNQDNHKGKWGDANTGRTVVLTSALTEDAIYDAMRNYRVYATEDNDLSVYYKLDGNIMGTILSEGDAGEMVTVSLELNDPTDSAIGKVEVIVNGGLSIETKQVDTASANLEFQVPGAYSYYYIKITQNDGDIAVTAPVWVGAVEAVGISGLSTTAALPVQNQALDLTLDLYNNESKDLEIDSIVFSIGDQTIHTATSIDRVEKMDTASYTFSYTHTGLGSTEILATVTGTLDGVQKVYQEKLELNYTTPDMVTRVLVDGTHYNDYVTGYYGGNMGNMTKIAAESQIEVTVVTDEITPEMLETCSLLIISAPARASGTANAGAYTADSFEDSFLTMVKNYVDAGGSVIVCGLADYQDKKASSADGHIAAQLNRLLAAIGSSMTINDDEAYDDDNNGGQAYRLYPETFNTASDWTSGMLTGQVYSQYSGCTVNPGNGTWLVKGFDTTYSIDSDNDGIGGVSKGNAVFLACEDTAYGGTIFAAGGVFVSDFEVKAELDNIWDLPYANRTILENIMADVRVEMPLSTIAEVRQGEMDEVFRIQGYVTSGTANENTTFFDSIYVQDETAGITVFPFSTTGLAIGTPIEIVGYVDEYQGDKEIQIISYKVLGTASKVYEPRSVTTQQATDYATYGGQLIQTTGTVSDIIKENGIISQFKLTDSSGVAATIFIDGYITNEDGENDIASWIKNGQTVTGAGLLYMHPEGDSEVSVPVLRVRNCDEIVLKSGSSGGSSSGGSTSSGGGSTTTEKNDDGSTTTTTTDKATGTVTETTKTTSGVTGTTVTDKNGNVTNIEATIPASAANAAKKNGEAVTIPVTVPVTNSTSTAPSVSINVPNAGAKVEIPVDNATTGMVAVIVNPDGTEKIVKQSLATEDGVVLTLEKDATVKVIDNSTDFADVAPNSTFESAIDFMSARELMNGVGDGSIFNGNAPATRAMVWTILGRGVDADLYGAGVFTKAQDWAVKNGVSDGSNPNDTITRQQLAVMLWRQAGQPVSSHDISRFADTNGIADYANVAMRWAVENGILSGNNGNLNPGGAATRNHIAAMYMRWADAMN